MADEDPLLQDVLDLFAQDPPQKVQPTDLDETDYDQPTPNDAFADLQKMILSLPMDKQPLFLQLSQQLHQGLINQQQFAIQVQSLVGQPQKKKRGPKRQADSAATPSQ